MVNERRDLQGEKEDGEAILIAEDEPSVREITVSTLRRAGYQTIAAENGEVAVEALRANIDRISLVVLDVIMPKLGGHDAYTQMKEFNPSLKAIFCSGYDPETANTNLFVKQGLHVMQKPYDPDELLQAVREALATQESGELAAVQ